MTNNQYISALKKALSGMDRSSRNDIVQEIESHAAESGTSLLERFGSPETLAKQYLEGEIVAKPVGKKLLGVGKHLLTWIGLAVVALIVIAAVFFWSMSGDDFNYADENASELKSQDTHWVTKPWGDESLTIKLDQASSVFYWHSDKTVRWSCLGESQPAINAEGVMNMRHVKCLVYLPKSALKVEADQSQVVLVRPQASMDIQLEQASLRIAENGHQYRYEIDAKRSKVGALQSHVDAALSLNIQSHESMIEQYKAH